MKDEKNVRRCRAAGNRWRPAALLLAAVLAAVSVPFFGKSVFAVDLDRECSLTITSSASSDEEKALLDEAGVVLDIYRVADATEDSTYDTYHWSPVSLLEEITLPEYTDAAGWRTTTQKLSDAILGTAPEGYTMWNPDELTDAVSGAYPDADEEGYPLKLTEMPLGEKIEGLKPGLYFIVARGVDVDDYCAVNSTETDEDNSSEDPSDEGSTVGTVTLAKSSDRVYQFTPELVAVPTKDARTDTGEVNTANPSEWIYDANAVLKPARLSTGGDVEIVKILSSYDDRTKSNGGETGTVEDATFVFEVTVYESKASYEADPENASTIYHNYISMSFSEPTTRRSLVKNMPVGSYVVVTEVYSGRNYECTTGTTKTAVLPPNGSVELTFENIYNGKKGGGGFITNNFTRDDSGWSLEQVFDSSTESMHIGYPAQKSDSAE